MGRTGNDELSECPWGSVHSNNRSLLGHFLSKSPPLSQESQSGYQFFVSAL